MGRRGALDNTKPFLKARGQACYHPCAPPSAPVKKPRPSINSTPGKVAQLGSQLLKQNVSSCSATRQLHKRFIPMIQEDKGGLDPGDEEATEIVLVENCLGANWAHWCPVTSWEPGSSYHGIRRWCFGDVGRRRQKVARAGLHIARFCGHGEHFTGGAL